MTDAGTAVAGRIWDALNAAENSLNWLADNTGIPYKTLWRRLNIAPDQFKISELAAVARVIDIPWPTLFFGIDADEFAA